MCARACAAGKMSSFSSLYVVPQDSYDKYLKQQKSTSKGVFPSAKTVKVQQLNINEAENINNINSPGSGDKKRGEKAAAAGMNSHHYLSPTTCSETWRR